MRRVDLAARLRAQFLDGSGWTSRDAVDPHDGVIEELRGGRLDRRAVADALPALLVEEALRVRTGAVALLSELARDVGPDRVTAILWAHEPAFRGVRPAWRIAHEDLEQAAAVALAAVATARDASTVALLRALAFARPWRAYLVPTLAKLDPELVASHARELVTHADLAVLAALDLPRAERVIAALSPYPPEVPTVFTKAFWGRLAPEHARALRARMWPDATPRPG